MDQNKEKGMRNPLEDAHAEHREKMYGDLPWKAWGSWFSWGSPIGIGFFFLAIGATVILLRYASLMH